MSELDVVIQAQELSPGTVSAFSTALRCTARRRGASLARFSPDRPPSGDERHVLGELALAEACDIAVIRRGMRLADFKAAFFDMDSTLTSSETLDEMAEIAGVGDEVARITRSAMEGKIDDYAGSLRRRVALRSGCSAGSLETVWRNMRVNPGAAEFVSRLRGRGLRTYIVSSGFSALAGRRCEKLGMTGFCSNEIIIERGRYTGGMRGPAAFGGTLLDAEGKLRFVEATMRTLGADPASAICCGDGENDVGMVAAAGLGVGFRPKPLLRPHADATVDVLGFDSLLALFEDA